MSLESFLKSVGHGLHNVTIKISQIFVGIFGTEAASQFGHAALALLKSDLGQLVVAEVEALAGQTGLDGATKQANAQQAVLDKAKSLGISTSVSIVNMLIELAVQFVKGNLQTGNLPTTA